MKKILVFGVFDGLHEGHRAFLRQARRLGDHLIVAITPDHLVKKLKKRSPKIGVKTRARRLRHEGLAHKVVVGDSVLSRYKVLIRHKPHIIALGYDQRALQKDLKKHLQEFRWHPKLKIMKPAKPGAYHSSLISKRS